jgi:ATP-dependent RNA helicase RhlE
MNFKDFKLANPIQKALDGIKFTEPTEIQIKAIPEILAGQDIVASAKTGSGKTAAYVLPLLSLITREKKISKRSQSPLCLVLCPTRELANQIDTEIKRFSRYLEVNTVTITGGISYKLQNKLLKSHLDFVIATPGRLIDLMRQKKINLKSVKAVILDEADRMLDMGFIPDIKKIYEGTSREQQTLMFTATMNKKIEAIASQFLNDPVRISVDSEMQINQNITQYYSFVKDYDGKKIALNQILKQPDFKQAIVFTATKKDADKLADELYMMSIKAKALHGDMSQSVRTKTINRFKKNDFQVLVATDIASRGIDIQDITHVVNFDFPRDPEDYIHRIGRTGRAKNKGKSFLLLKLNERYKLKKIERLHKSQINELSIDGLKIDLTDINTREESNFKKKRRARSSQKKNYSRRSNFGGDKPKSDRPRSDKPKSDRPRSDKSRSRKPRKNMV